MPPALTSPNTPDRLRRGGGLVRVTGDGVVILSPAGGKAILGAAARSGSIPGVMASPPTVTLGVANAATAITDSVLEDSDGGWFRYLGTLAEHGPIYPETIFRCPENSSGNGTIKSAGAYFVGCDYDGQKVEFFTKGTTGIWQLAVDEGNGWEYATSALVASGAANANNGAGYLHLIDFGTRAFRRLRFELASNTRFGGLRREPTATVMAPTSPRGPKVIVVGDSFTEGTGATSSVSGFVTRMGQMLGWLDVVNSGAGATGYLALPVPNTFSRVIFRNRLQTDVIDQAADIVIFAGGLNDRNVTEDTPTYTYDEFETEVRACFQMVRAGLPNAVLIAVGPWWIGGSPTDGLVTLRNRIQAAAADLADLFIDPIVATSDYHVGGANVNVGWMTGFGHVGAELGTGNADLYTGADGTHPTELGHIHLGTRLAGAIQAWGQRA